MTCGAEKIRRARERRKLPEEVIQLILDRMAVGKATAAEQKETRLTLLAWRRPERPRTPGLLRQQGAALNYVQQYKKDHKIAPEPGEIKELFGLELEQAELILDGGNGRISEEAQRQRASKIKSANWQSAEHGARFVAEDDSNFDQPTVETTNERL